MVSVLIVEDDLLIADMLQEALEADKYLVTGIARTVQEAVLLADRYFPDVAIVDLHLANGDLGTSVAAHLRDTSKTKILFSTGNSDHVVSLEAYGDAVMTKPYLLRDVGKALAIIDELARHGRTDLAFPRSFRLLALVEP
jgi:DNA-binding response OmpR family regulator